MTTPVAETLWFKKSGIPSPSISVLIVSNDHNESAGLCPDEGWLSNKNDTTKSSNKRNENAMLDVLSGS